MSIPATDCDETIPPAAMVPSNPLSDDDHYPSRTETDGQRPTLRPLALDKAKALGVNVDKETDTIDTTELQSLLMSVADWHGRTEQSGQLYSVRKGDGDRSTVNVYVSSSPGGGPTPG